MSLRLRLALWYTALAGVVVGAVLLAAFLSHSATLAFEIDAQLHGVAQRAAARVIAGIGPQEGVTAASLQPITDFTDAEIWVRYFDRTGHELAESANAAGRPVLFALLPAGSGGVYVDGQDRGERLRGYIQPVQRGTVLAGYLTATTSLVSVDRLNDRFAGLLLVIAAGGLLLTAGAGGAVAAGALRPIRTIITTAQAIALARGFSRRLPPAPRRDELGQLTRTLNEMLNSLEAAYAAQRRFVDDAAHELRAPLTVIQGNLALLQAPQSLGPEEREQVLADLAGEVQQLGHLVNALLALARADAGQQGRQAVVELDAVLTTGYRRLRALDPPVELHIGALAPLCVRGDVDQLEQLLLILGENALRYTRPGGRVELGLAAAEGTAVLTVRDTGIGIPADELPYIFDRFSRGAAARTLRRDGTGLGLPIARWIAESHGAGLTVESQPGQGSCFTVRFPAIACQADADSLPHRAPAPPPAGIPAPASPNAAEGDS
jgi:signal transduction histidine kinase